MRLYHLFAAMLVGSSLCFVPSGAGCIPSRTADAIVTTLEGVESATSMLDGAFKLWCGFKPTSCEDFAPKYQKAREVLDLALKTAINGVKAGSVSATPEDVRQAYLSCEALLIELGVITINPTSKDAGAEVRAVTGWSPVYVPRPRF